MADGIPPLRASSRARRVLAERLDIWCCIPAPQLDGTRSHQHRSPLLPARLFLFISRDAVAAHLWQVCRHVAARPGAREVHALREAGLAVRARARGRHIAMPP
jgi:hypothetical protein